MQARKLYGLFDKATDGSHAAKKSTKETAFLDAYAARMLHTQLISAAMKIKLKQVSVSLKATGLSRSSRTAQPDPALSKVVFMADGSRAIRQTYLIGSQSFVRHIAINEPSGQASGALASLMSFIAM